jgi:hypothetical protein
MLPRVCCTQAVGAHGLYVMATYYLGDVHETPIGSAAERDAVIEGFVQSVEKYAVFPSLLVWSFGNELNGNWLGFMQQLAKTGGLPHDATDCAWDWRYVKDGGCMGNLTSVTCTVSSACV